MLFTLSDLYKMTSVRKAVFLSTLLTLGTAKRKNNRDNIEKMLIVLLLLQLITLILVFMSHTCAEHPCLINIETILVYTDYCLHSK